VAPTGLIALVPGNLQVAKQSRPGSPVTAAPPSDRSNRITVALLVCGVAAPALFVPFVLLAASVTPRYSQISSTFSDAGAQGQPHPEIIGSGLFLLALTLALSAVGIARVLPRLGLATGASLIVSSIAIAGTAIFRDYNRTPGVSRNLEGFVHNACASVAILGIIVATVLTGLATRDQPGWKHLSAPAGIVALGAILAGVSFQTGPDARDGLAERAFATFSFVWLAVVSLNGIWVLAGQPNLRSRVGIDELLGGRLPSSDRPPDH
jgi:hypothetical membrane protein